MKPNVVQTVMRHNLNRDQIEQLVRDHFNSVYSDPNTTVEYSFDLGWSASVGVVATRLDQPYTENPE